MSWDGEFVKWLWHSRWLNCIPLTLCFTHTKPNQQSKTACCINYNLFTKNQSHGKTGEEILSSLWDCFEWKTTKITKCKCKNFSPLHKTSGMKYISGWIFGAPSLSSSCFVLCVKYFRNTLLCMEIQNEIIKIFRKLAT